MKKVVQQLPLEVLDVYLDLQLNVNKKTKKNTVSKLMMKELREIMESKKF